MDIKEREERRADSKLQATVKELAVQNEHGVAAAQALTEAELRLDSALQLAASFEAGEAKAKSNLAVWKKYGLIATGLLLLSLIVLLLK